MKIKPPDGCVFIILSFKPVLTIVMLLFSCIMSFICIFSFFSPDPSSQGFFYSVFSKNQLLVLLVFIAFLFSILLVSILFFVSLLILFWGLLCFF